MNIAANVIVGVARFYSILIFAYVLMSWFPTRGFIYDVQRVLASIVEPYLSLFRRFIPPIGNVDLSPIIAYFVLLFGANALANLLR